MTMQCFAFHLSNFDFKFDWMIWSISPFSLIDPSARVDAVDLPEHDARRCFVRELFLTLVSLAYW